MDIFFYIGMIGAFMILFGNIQCKLMASKMRKGGTDIVLHKKSKNYFFVKIKNSFLYDLFYSTEFAKINLKYGVLLAGIGIAGMLLFKTIGIILVLAVSVVVLFYLLKVIVTLKDFIKNY